MRILSKKRSSGQLAGRVAMELGKMAVRLYQNPVIPLVSILLAVAIAGFAASKLKLETDLAALLPSSFESVKDLESLKASYGGEGYLVVVGRDADPKALERFADDISPRLSRLPGVQYVEHLRPTEFFKDRALYFMSREDLETIKERLDKRKKWEILHANPLYVDLLDTKRPPLDFSDLEQKYKKAGGVAALIGSPDSPYYIDKEQRMIAVLVKPTGLASDLSFAQGIVNSVQSVVKGMNLSSYGPQMRVELTGRYKKRVDMQAQIRTDLGLGFIVAQILMFLYVIFHFRRKAAIVFVFFPLTVGLVLTFGFAGLVFGELNILTAFIGTILMGTGIDHGIHLLSNYQAECAERREGSDAIFRTFSVIGRAVLAAALTMVVAFAALGLSEFKAFYQFGILAAAGSIFILASYLICLPVLLGLASRMKWNPQIVRGSGASAYSRFVSKRAGSILAVFLLFCLGALPGITKASFNYDFASLDDSKLPSYKLDDAVNKIMGHSQTPLVVSVPKGANEAAYVEALRKRKAEYGSRSSVDFILSEADLIPRDQEAKQKIIEQIGHIVRLFPLEKLDPAQRRFAEQARKMTQTSPFSRADLPENVVRKLQGKDSRTRYVLIFPSIKLTRGDLVLGMARELRDIPVGGGTLIRAAGEPMILADMLKMIYREALPILAVVLALVLVSMWLLLGSFRLSLFCLSTSAVTILAAVGVWSYLGFQFNYLNIIMIPLLLGIGVAGGLHMVIRLRAWRDVDHTLSRTAPPVTGSMLTIIIGFGTMMLAHHPGLRSLGELAVLGLTINLGVCLLAIAALMAIYFPAPQRAFMAGLFGPEQAAPGLVAAGGMMNAPCSNVLAEENDVSDQLCTFHEKV